MAYTLDVSIDDRHAEESHLMVDFKARHVKGELVSYIFEDHGFRVFYSPSLNLSAYGNTDEEAKSMMVDAVMPDMFKAMLNKPKFEVFEYLGKLGWSAVDRNAETYNNTAYVDKEGILRNFDLPIDTPIEAQLVTV